MQTKLRTHEIIPNDNICFPIGTILAVEKLYDALQFYSVFSKYKKKGLDINSLLKALTSYKLTDNFSIDRAHDWINREDVLELFNLKKFNERGLYRTLQTLGNNSEEIIFDIQDILFRVYDFSHTDVNMDWTSIVLHGDKSQLGKYGYSRDHRPDKKQITIGVSELSDPINIPIGLTVEQGNVNDQKHFKKTYRQISKRLRKNSLVVFDKGANSIGNIKLIRADKMQYLTAKKLNKSDDKIIEKFGQLDTEVIDEEKGIYGYKIVKPNSINYLFFSKTLQKQQLESKARKILRMIHEAKEIQESIDNNKKIPKRFLVNNVLIDVSYSIQTKLMDIGEEEAIKLLEEQVITCRE
jgi:transposase